MGKSQTSFGYLFQQDKKYFGLVYFATYIFDQRIEFISVVSGIQKLSVTNRTKVKKKLGVPVVFL